MQTLPEAVHAAKAGRSLSIKCPAHNDRAPSLSVGPGTGGAVLLKCFAGCSTLDVLRTAGLSWKDVAGTSPIQRSNPKPAEDNSKQAMRSSWPEFTAPSESDIHRIASIRRLGTDGVRLAAELGILRVCQYRGHPAWVVTDAEKMAAQARRMDGAAWETSTGKPKALTLPGSVGLWPVGVASLTESHRSVLVVEGGPDLLAAFHFIAIEGRATNASAVALLGASMKIADHTLPRFEGRRVRIVEQSDVAGRKATKNWAEQLRAHTQSVDAIRLDGLRQFDGTPVEDLNHLACIDADDFESARWTCAITP